MLIFFLLWWGEGWQGEKLVAAFQSDIPVALRTVFCQLLSELHSFYVTDSLVTRSWGARECFND